MKPLHRDVFGLAFILLWSSGYIVGALATQVMDPLAVTMWRFAVAASVLAAIAVLRRERWPHGRELLALAGIGVPLFAVQFGALYSGLADGMPAGTTSLIACSSPLVIAAISALAGWERLRPVQWMGIALGVLGVGVTLADRVGRPPNLASLLWALLGLTGLAIGTTLQSRVKHHAGPTAMAAVEVAAGFVVMAIWAPLKAQSLTIPLSPQGLFSFTYLALAAGVCAPLMLFALIRQRGATRASSYLFVVPAVTALLAWPTLGTPVGLLTLAGLVIVTFALILTTGSLGRRPEPAAPSRPVGATPPRDPEPAGIGT